HSPLQTQRYFVWQALLLALPRHYDRGVPHNTPELLERQFHSQHIVKASLLPHSSIEKPYPLSNLKRKRLFSFVSLKVHNKFFVFLTFFSSELPEALFPSFSLTLEITSYTRVNELFFVNLSVGKSLINSLQSSYVFD